MHKLFPCIDEETTLSITFKTGLYILKCLQICKEYLNCFIKKTRPIHINWCYTPQKGGHGGRLLTLSPPTSAARVRSPSWP